MIDITIKFGQAYSSKDIFNTLDNYNSGFKRHANPDQLFKRETKNLSSIEPILEIAGIVLNFGLLVTTLVQIKQNIKQNRKKAESNHTTIFITIQNVLYEINFEKDDDIKNFVDKVTLGHDKNYDRDNEK